MAELVALDVPLGIMPLEDCSIVFPVTVLLRLEEGNKGFWLQGKLLCMYVSNTVNQSSVKLIKSLYNIKHTSAFTNHLPVIVTLLLSIAINSQILGELSG